MKRIFKYLLGIILLIPMFVLADGGGPIFAQYDARVSDKNGAYLYKYNDENDKLEKSDILLTYNYQVKITYESEMSENEFYGRIYYPEKPKSSDEDNSEYEYYINLSKISLIKEELTFEDLKKEIFTGVDSQDLNYKESEDYFSSNRDIIAVKDNIKLYKGPALKYKEKDEKISKNQVLTVKADINGWLYVQCNKYS
jgi:hypothetical protein